MKKQTVSANKTKAAPEGYTNVRAEIVELLSAARSASVRSVNALMTATYWEVGRRIVEFEQKGKKRADYGEAIIRQLAHDLTQRFGRGFGVVNLSQMKNFYLAWAPQQIFQTPSEKSAVLSVLAAKFSLPWSAYVRLLSVKNAEARTPSCGTDTRSSCAGPNPTFTLSRLTWTFQRPLPHPLSSPPPSEVFSFGLNCRRTRRC